MATRELNETLHAAARRRDIASVESQMSEADGAEDGRSYAIARNGVEEGWRHYLIDCCSAVGFSLCR